MTDHSNNGRTGNPTSQVLGRLDNVEGTGPEYLARCPAHNDKKNSLSVRHCSDKVLLKCHRGCSVDSIVRAIGLEMSDLFASGCKKQIVATYDYCDENGERLYQAVRYEPKDFRQRRPDGKGGWQWNLGNVRRVLYRLPELLAGNPNRPVLIVEGEKDADRLRDEFGAVATTSAMGAGKWRPEYNDALKDRKVVIIPDNDAAGDAHALLVADSVHGVARSVQVFKLPGLPEKGDVSDWIDAGGTKREFIQLVKAAPKYDPARGSSGTSTTVGLP